MVTEEQVIYGIWNIVRGGEFNQDDHINERLMRSFLSIHRGKHLDLTFDKGNELPDEVFQYLGPIPMTYANNQFVSSALPKIIRFSANQGLMADIQGYTVSIVGNEEWRNSRKDKYNKYHPMMKFVNNRLWLSKGMLQANQLDDVSGSELNTVVNILNPDPIPDPFITNVNVQAVLVDTDDEPGYDFTTSPYPYPDELVEDLINSVNAREFSLYLRTQSDQTGDLQDDTKAQPENKDI